MSSLTVFEAAPSGERLPGRRSSKPFAGTTKGCAGRDDGCCVSSLFAISTSATSSKMGLSAGIRFPPAGIVCHWSVFLTVHFCSLRAPGFDPCQSTLAGAEDLIDKFFFLVPGNSGVVAALGWMRHYARDLQSMPQSGAVPERYLMYAQNTAAK